MRRTFYFVIAVALFTSELLAAGYSRLVVFGDCFVDTGNYKAVISATDYPPPYWEGRISNGPVWVEYLAELLAVPAPGPSTIPGADNTNHAYAGACASLDRPVATGVIPSVLSQVARAYPPDTVAAGDELFILQAGGNDVTALLMMAGGNPDLVDPSIPASALAGAVGMLYARGARNFIVVNLPPPQAPFFDQPHPWHHPELKAGWEILAPKVNALLQLQLSGLTTAYPDLRLLGSDENGEPALGRTFDLYGTMCRVLDHPLDYGFENAVDRVFDPLDVPALRGDPEVYLFWDHYHVTRAGHEGLANEVYRALATPMLGTASGYAMLGLNAKISMSNPSTLIDGDVGLGPQGLQNFSDGHITGTFFVDPTADNAHNNRVVIDGGTVVKDLSSAVADARAASAAASALPTTQTFGRVTNTLTIVGKGGLNVISIQSVNFTGSSDVLTLRGTDRDFFVINVAESIVLTHTASSIQVSGVPVSHVLFNLTTRGDGLKTSGNPSVAGIFLVPNGKIRLTPGRVSGAIIAGTEITLSGGASIR